MPGKNVARRRTAHEEKRQTRNERRHAGHYLDGSKRIAERPLQCVRANEIEKGRGASGKNARRDGTGFDVDQDRILIGW